jgi:formylmethanofuran dehydrogenase subunit A
MTPATADRLVLAQGTIHDPATGRNGVIDDIWVEGGTIVPRPADARGFQRIDCTGLVVMPGGVDLHSHVAGPKVGFGRRIAPHLARRDGVPSAVPTIHATGAAYAFFAPLLGWLGVALTGSDTSSNAMFGSLQRVTAEQLGLDPLLVCTANSTGGVMGKMIDAQSIVVSATATGTHRREGEILRRVFPHSLALAALMGLLVWLQAGPLSWMVPSGR